MNVIKGNTAPKAEEKTFYEVGSGLFAISPSPFFKEEQGKYIWTLSKKEKGTWIPVSKNIKYGKKVPYTFGEKVVGIPYKIEVHQEGKNLLNQVENKFFATLIVTPRSAKEPSIGRVILLNRGKADINKANFNESLSAQARTANLVGREITFYLWEEGAKEEDKYKKPKKARVDKNGIAEVKFSLMEYASQPLLMQIFNFNSKTTKKFFVTAVYENKKSTNKGAVEASDANSNAPKKEDSDGILSKGSEVLGEGWNYIVKSFEKALTPTSVGTPEIKKGDDKIEKKDGTCSCNNDLTKEQLQAIAINASQANIDKYFDGFNETFTKFNINSCLQKLHFLAQVIHESGSFRYNVEQGNEAYLAKYGGWHGRGLIQLTTKSNYEAFEKAIGEDVTSSKEAKDKVTKTPYAVYSAGWFWDKRAVLNGYADKNDFIYITYRVNGGYNHIDDRLAIVKRGFTTLYSKCVNDEGKTTNYKFADSKAYNDKKASFAWGLWHDSQFSKAGCNKDKDLAMEGYQRYVDLTTETDSTANYYGIQNLSYFSDLVYTKILKGKAKKYVSVRKAALKRLNDL